MSISLNCPSCGETVGVDDCLYGFRSKSLLAETDEIACPGKDKHRPPVRAGKRKFFGLIERVTVTYPETRTCSSWNEYVGPKRPFYVWLAIVLGDADGIVINGKWCWWSAKLGFYGDGASEFQPTQFSGK